MVQYPTLRKVGRREGEMEDRSGRNCRGKGRVQPRKRGEEQERHKKA